MSKLAGICALALAWLITRDRRDLLARIREAGW